MSPVHLYRRVNLKKKGWTKVQKMPQSLGAVLPRHQGEEKTVKTKQAHIGKMYKML